jgi:methionine-rich copper-binding protein CopC
MRMALVLTALLLAPPAFAHAFLGRASPSAGTELKTAPKAVTIEFTEPVEPRFSSIEVRDSSGARVDTGSPHAAGKPTSIAVDLKPLPPGTYIVVWRAASVDTHKTEGKYIFTVLP